MSMSVEQALSCAMRVEAAFSPVLRVLDHEALITLAAEVERVRRLGSIGSVDSWLQLSDDDKRAWFATTVDRDTEHVERIRELEAEVERLRGAGVPAEALRLARVAIDECPAGQAMVCDWMEAALKACVIPAVPTCAHCGAQASTHGPVIPTITPANRRQIVNRVTSGTGSGIDEH